LTRLCGPDMNTRRDSAGTAEPRGHTSSATWYHGGLMILSPTLAQRFAAYATRLRYEDIPSAAIHEAKRRLIDSFGTAVGAMPSDAFAIARECALRVRSTPGATMLGGGQ